MYTLLYYFNTIFILEVNFPLHLLRKVRMLVNANELLKMTLLTHEIATMKCILKLEEYWSGKLKVVGQIIKEENESKN